MPAKSEKQRKFMNLCINNPSKARGKCPSKAAAKRVLGKHRGKR